MWNEPKLKIVKTHLDLQLSV